MNDDNDQDTNQGEKGKSTTTSSSGFMADSTDDFVNPFHERHASNVSSSQFAKLYCETNNNNSTEGTFQTSLASYTLNDFNNSKITTHLSAQDRKTLREDLLHSVDSLALRVFKVADIKMAQTQKLLNEEIRKVEQSHVTLESLLSDIQSTKQPYENRYFELLKEHDKVRLTCVKLNSKLDQANNTIAALRMFRNKSSMANDDDDDDGIGGNVDGTNEPLVGGDDNDDNETENHHDVFNDVAALLDDMDKKMKLKTAVSTAELALLNMFLEKLERQKLEERDKLNKDVELVRNDLFKVQQQLKENTALSGSSTTSSSSSSQFNPFGPSSDDGAASSSGQTKRGRKRTQNDPMTSGDSLSITKKQRIHDHFAGLERDYFDSRRRGTNPVEFSKQLSHVAQYSKIVPIATFRSGISAQSAAAKGYDSTDTCVCTIAFNQSSELFTVAGVSKLIQVYDYGTVLKYGHNMDEMRPLQEMSNQDRITCTSWNFWQKQMLASSDYAGSIRLWDVSTGSEIIHLKEHANVAWYVDFSRQDHNMFASCSNDRMVKLWHTTQPESTACIKTKSAVCSVKFNPVLENQLAFASSDHSIYYYDVRKLDQPLLTLVGHRKSVAEISWLSRDQLVSQSTDETIKLWHVNASLQQTQASSKPSHTRRSPIATFTGHKQIEQFVGVSAHRGYIASGSEDNACYVYSSKVGQPLLTHSFNTGQKNKDERSFVSAVCWKPDSNVIVAGNSRGFIKLLGVK